VSEPGRGTREVEEHLAAFAVVSMQITASTIWHLGRREARAISRALWRSSTGRRDLTWKGITARALERARDRGLAEVVAHLSALSADDVLDDALRAHGAEPAARVEDSFAATARCFFACSERVQDAKDPDERWSRARGIAVLANDALGRIRGIVGLLDWPAARVAPLEEMLARSARLVVSFAVPEHMVNVDPAATQSFLRHAAEQRAVLAEELGVDEEPESEEPARSPEETLARLERAASELLRIAEPLGRRADEVLFAGEPPSPTTWVAVRNALDEQLAREPIEDVVGAAVILDRQLPSAPETGTESVLRQAAEKLEVAAETLRASPERHVVQKAELVLRLVAAQTVAIAVGAGEIELAERLARIIGLEDGVGPLIR
jgi:hypothetical protein